MSLVFLLGVIGCQPPGSKKGNITLPSPEVSGEEVMDLLEDAAVEFQELSKPDKVRAWVDNLIVKSQPGKDMPQVATMREGEEATYLYQRTIRKSNFSLRNQAYNEPWLLIRTRDSVTGWVHGGGVLFVQPDIGNLFAGSKEDQQRMTQQRRSANSGTQEMNPQDIHQLEKADFAIVPGFRVGPIHLNTTENDLVRWYGPAVTRGKVKLTEKSSEDCTILYEGTFDELRIIWKDPKKTTVKTVYVTQPNGKWHLQEGVRVGMELSDLTKINRSPVSFYGFNWDYSGTISSFRKGALAPYEKLFYIQLGPGNSKRVAELVKKFNGNKVFTSNTEGIARLNLVIERIGVYLD
ncbi:MAG: SH3 domain-containing protein [Bacteroidota bacterium]